MQDTYFEMSPASDAPSPSFSPVEAVPAEASEEDTAVAEEKSADAQFGEPVVDSDPLNTYLQVILSDYYEFCQCHFCPVLTKLALDLHVNLCLFVYLYFRLSVFLSFRYFFQGV